MVICLERCADLLIPLPLTVSCFSKIQIGFTFLVPAHPGSPGKRAVKRVCVCVTVTVVTDRETDIGPYTKLRYGVEPRSAKTSLHCTYTVDLYALAVVIHHVALSSSRHRCLARSLSLLRSVSFSRRSFRLTPATLTSLSLYLACQLCFVAERQAFDNK